MQDLAATSGATVYTTWAIGADNVPVALGDFTVGGSGTASFTAAGPPVAPGAVIALTLDPGLAPPRRPARSSRRAPPT